MCWLVVLQLSLAANPSARELLKRGHADYAHGRFDRAADELLAADALVPDPVLLLKAARGFEKAGRFEKALSTYRGYLRRVPAGPGHAAVRKAIDRLSKKLDAAEPSLALVPLAPPPSAAAPVAQAPVVPAPVASPAPALPVAAPSVPPPVVLWEADKPSTQAEAKVASRSGALWLSVGGYAAIALSILPGWYGGWGAEALSESQHNQSLASPTAKAVYTNEIHTYTAQTAGWLSVSGVLLGGGIALIVAGHSAGVAPTASSVSVARVPGGAAIGWGGAL